MHPVEVTRTSVAFPIEAFPLTGDAAGYAIIARQGHEITLYESRGVFLVIVGKGFVPHPRWPLGTFQRMIESNEFYKVSAKTMAELQAALGLPLKQDGGVTR